MRIILDIQEEVEAIRINAAEWAAKQAQNPNLSEKGRTVLGSFGYIRPYQWAEILVMYLQDAIADKTGVARKNWVFGQTDGGVDGDNEVEDFLDQYVCDQVFEKIHMLSRALAHGTIWQLQQYSEYGYELVYVGHRSILEPAIRASGGSFRKFIQAIMKVEDPNKVHDLTLKDMAEEEQIIKVRLTDRILSEQCELPEDHPDRWHRLKREAGHIEEEEEEDASAKPVPPEQWA